MLTVAQVAKSYSGRTLFENASLQVNRGERIGLVGPNGAGKSTLFSLILGESSPDQGRVALDRGLTLGFLPQEGIPPGDESVLELATAHVDAEHRWEIEPQARRVLAGLAFRESDMTRPARNLRGDGVAGVAFQRVENKRAVLERNRAEGKLDELVRRRWKITVAG